VTASRPAAGRAVRAFGLPGRAALTRLAGESAAGLVGAADLALVIDPAGVIIDAAASGGGVTGMSAASAGPEGGYAALLDSWIGRRLADVVTPESRGKVEMLLREAAGGAAGAGGTAPRRQVNHLTPDGPDLPVAYTGVRLADGTVVLVGRDLRAVAALQQRLVETQQALERDYWRLRHVETRYRLLFQRAREAVLVVDAGTRKVVDANAAAGALFGTPADRLVGRAFPPDTAASVRQPLDDLLAATRFEGAGDEVDVTFADGRRVRAAASCFRQDAQTLFLVRFAEVSEGEGGGSGLRVGAPDSAPLAELLAGAPDGFVVSDAEGHVVTANRAFLDLAQLGDAAQAVGRPLSAWVGRPGADMPVLLGMVRQHGVVRLVSTAVRGEHGTATEVELSAVRAPDDSAPSVAWTIRDVGRRVGAPAGGARDLTRAVEQLTGLVGRVSLPDLVKDTVEMVERHFIEAALELTRDNRTAAAEVLGLSRQSLYLKLRRHRLLPTEADADSGA
jgi:transcriptional regulator PpsR